MNSGLQQNPEAQAVAASTNWNRQSQDKVPPGAESPQTKLSSTAGFQVPPRVRWKVAEEERVKSRERECGGRLGRRWALGAECWGAGDAARRKVPSDFLAGADRNLETLGGVVGKVR